MKSIFYIVWGFILLLGCCHLSGESTSCRADSGRSSQGKIACITADTAIEYPETDCAIRRSGDTIPEYGGYPIKSAVIRLLPQVRLSYGGRCAPVAWGYCDTPRKQLPEEIRAANNFRPAHLRHSSCYSIYALERMRI